MYTCIYFNIYRGSVYIYIIYIYNITLHQDGRAKSLTSEKENFILTEFSCPERGNLSRCSAQLYGNETLPCQFDEAAGAICYNGNNGSIFLNSMATQALGSDFLGYETFEVGPLTKKLRQL